MRFRLLTYLVGISLLYSAATYGQVVEGKSRLGIGQNPKKPAASYAVSTRVPSEIRLNKSVAVNQYYRQVMLTNGSKKVAPAGSDTKVVAADVQQNDDFLYASDRVRVSRVYPNPANDFAKMDYKIAGNSKVTVVFYDFLMNAKIGSYELDSFDSDVTIQTRNWKQGIYLYQLIVDGQKVATKKLVVQHN